jgi:hypothetical protein
MNKVVLTYICAIVGLLSKTLICVFSFAHNNKGIFKLMPANKI